LNQDLQDPITKFKIDNFSSYLSYDNFPQNISIHVHLNITNDRDISKLFELNKITKLNTRSKLMVHCDIGHMIHYKIPSVIITSINDLI
jgi:hypothetical protein